MTMTSCLALPLCFVCRCVSMRREGGCQGECGAMLCVVTELVEELSVSVCRASRCTSVKNVPCLSGERPSARGSRSDVVGRRSGPAHTVGIIEEVFLFLRWLVWGITHDSNAQSTYRGLVSNGSSGFSTKKVEFPPSL